MSLLQNSSLRWRLWSYPSSPRFWDPSWASWRTLWRSQPGLHCCQERWVVSIGKHTGSFQPLQCVMGRIIQCCLLVVKGTIRQFQFTSTASSPDPDLAATESVILSAGGQNSCGLDRGGIRAAGWFSQTEGGNVLTWRDKHTRAVSTPWSARSHTTHTHTKC